MFVSVRVGVGAGAGAAVVVTGRDEERGLAVIEEIVDADGRAVSLPADIGEEASIERFVADTADTFGGPDAAPVSACSLPSCRSSATITVIDAICGASWPSDDG